MNIMFTAIVAASLAAIPLANAGPSCSSGKSKQASSKTMENQKANIIETALAAGSFNTLATALTAADLVDALQGDGPFTVFAPTDEAFAKLPEGTVEYLLKPENKDQLVSVLTYHVTPGTLDAQHVLASTAVNTLNGQRAVINASNGTIGDAKIITTDIECSNGIIHVIDSVILPKSDSILETASSAGSFSTLAAAVKAAGLDGVLSGDGPFTVFAPTDEAFAKLPKGTVESLLKPENIETLRSILLSHVVDGRVYSDQAIEAKNAETIQGANLKVSVKKGSVMINSSKVQSADIETSNGVIHVIDTVIIPNES